MSPRILYGVQGTGNGHISRARKMATHLQRRVADVTFLFSGRAPGDLFDMAPFGDYLHRDGLTFVTRNGRVDSATTLARARPLRIFRDLRQLPLGDIDLVVTDFEPLSAWAGRRAGVPVIGIGHQYAFDYPIPVAGDAWHARWIMRNFAPARVSVGLHWYPFDTAVLPPVIDTDLVRAAPGEHFLVYLPFENQAAVTRVLSHFPARKFIQYAPGLLARERDNVSLRPTGLESFRRDLVRARGVVCNAGFELVSECLHLGVPVLARPLRGQMEQASNAAALRKLGWGATCEYFDEASLEAWLAAAPAPPRVRYPDVAERLVDWLLAGAPAGHLERIGHELWSRAEYPVEAPPLPRHAAA